VSERDESRHLAGAGTPTDPEVPEPVPGNGADAAPEQDRTAADVVRAVADFLDDLVDDPTFAHDPWQEPLRPDHDCDRGQA
jgi:hypothetical protein